MTCLSLPTPEQLRKAVDELIDRTSAAERPLLRARLYRETPAEGLAEEQGQAPKCRCAVCWTVRSPRLTWHDQNGVHRYTCASEECRLLWRKLGRSEERVHARAQGRLVEAVQGGEVA